MAFKKHTALLMTGLALCSSLALTTAFAKPTKPTKKPAKAVAAKVDVAAGKKVYTAQGCAGCHAIGGNGGNSGPDLTNYAGDTKKDAKWTAAQIKNPKVHNDSSAMPGYEDKIKGKDLEEPGRIHADAQRR